MMFRMIILILASVAVEAATPSARSPVDPKWYVTVGVYQYLGEPVKIREAQSEILVRREDGAVLYLGKTDSHGSITIPLDARSLHYDDQIEARVRRSIGGYSGSFVGCNPTTTRYSIVLPPEVDID